MKSIRHRGLHKSAVKSKVKAFRHVKVDPVLKIDASLFKEFRLLIHLTKVKLLSKSEGVKMTFQVCIFIHPGLKKITVVCQTLCAQLRGISHNCAELRAIVLKFRAIVRSLQGSQMRASKILLRFYSFSIKKYFHLPFLAPI